MYNNEELKHYGVLGMKWGVRKKARLQRRLDRNVARQKKELADLDVLRKDWRSVKEQYYDSRIARAKDKGKKNKAASLEKKKKNSLAEYDDFVRRERKGIEIYNKIGNDMAKLKIKAIDDPSIKKSDAYKKAEALLAERFVMDVLDGKSHTKTYYYRPDRRV